MWIKITLADIVRGTAVNGFGTADNSPYSVATILGIEGEKCKSGPDDRTVRLARPMAYAQEEFNSLQPATHCEVYTTTVRRLLEDGLVWKDSDNGKVRKYLVRAA